MNLNKQNERQEGKAKRSREQNGVREFSGGGTNQKTPTPKTVTNQCGEGGQGRGGDKLSAKQPKTLTNQKTPTPKTLTKQKTLTNPLPPLIRHCFRPPPHTDQSRHVLLSSPGLFAAYFISPLAINWRGPPTRRKQPLPSQLDPSPGVGAASKKGSTIHSMKYPTTLCNHVNNISCTQSFPHLLFYSALLQIFMTRLPVSLAREGHGLASRGLAEARGFPVALHGSAEIYGLLRGAQRSVTELGQSWGKPRENYSLELRAEQ